MRVRGSAGAGGVFASVVGIEGCESGAPKGAERFQTGQEALGRGRLPQGWNLDRRDAMNLETAVNAKTPRGKDAKGREMVRGLKRNARQRKAILAASA